MRLRGTCQSHSTHLAAVATGVWRAAAPAISGHNERPALAGTHTHTEHEESDGTMALRVQRGTAGPQATASAAGGQGWLAHTHGTEARAAWLCIIAARGRREAAVTRRSSPYRELEPAGAFLSPAHWRNTHTNKHSAAQRGIFVLHTHTHTPTHIHTDTHTHSWVEK